MLMLRKKFWMLFHVVAKYKEIESKVLDAFMILVKVYCKLDAVALLIIYTLFIQSTAVHHAFAH